MARSKIIDGVRYKVVSSPRRNKKYRVIRERDDEVITDYGAKGYTMRPGTERGDSYCARSSGIKGVRDVNSANFWARLDWNCKGKRSLKKRLL